MTHEEKAKGLVDKYMKEVFAGEYMPTQWSIDCAKACALIAVDEVINVIENMPVQDATRAWRKDLHTYWFEVRSSIQKL